MSNLLAKNESGRVAALPDLDVKEKCHDPCFQQDFAIAIAGE